MSALASAGRRIVLHGDARGATNTDQKFVIQRGQIKVEDTL
ncbi:hypothetical protein [Microbispora sp. CA-102843]